LEEIEKARTARNCKVSQRFFHYSMKKLNLPKLCSKRFLIRHYNSLLRSLQVPIDSQVSPIPRNGSVAWLLITMVTRPRARRSGFDSGQQQEILSSPKRPDVVRDRPSLLFNRQGDSFNQGYNGPVVKMKDRVELCLCYFMACTETTLPVPVTATE